MMSASDARHTVDIAPDELPASWGAAANQPADGTGLPQADGGGGESAVGTGLATIDANYRRAARLGATVADQVAATWRRQVGQDFRVTECFAKSATRIDRLQLLFAAQEQAVARFFESDELTQREALAAATNMIDDDGGTSPAAAANNNKNGSSPVRTAAPTAKPRERGSQLPPGVAEGDGADDADFGGAALISMWATRLSVTLNALLLLLKLWLFVASASLIIASSLADSLLEIVSGSLTVLVKLVRYKSPSSRRATSLLATALVSCVAFAVALRLFEACVWGLWQTGPQSRLRDLGGIANATTSAPVGAWHVDSTTFICFGVILACRLVALLLCRKIAPYSRAVADLATDHRYALVADAVGLVGLLVARYVWRFVDPAFAAVASGLIVFMWGRSAQFQVAGVAGRRAPDTTAAALTRIAVALDRRVLGVATETATVDFSGVDAEVEVVFDRRTALGEAFPVVLRLAQVFERLEGLDITRAVVRMVEAGHVLPTSGFSAAS